MQLCKVRYLRTADLGVQRSMGASVCYGLNGRFCNSGTEPSLMQLRSGFRPLASHHVVSQRRNSIEGVQFFGRGGANRSKVADVAIVAVAGRRISFFEFTLTPARATALSLCDLRITRITSHACCPASFTPEINSRECMGQFKLAHPAILVNGGGGTNIKGCITGWIKISINPLTH